MELRKYAEQQLERLQRSLEEALSIGDVEPVHQTRVASRRLEEPLELCRPWVGDKLVDRTVKRLRRLRRALRRVRDLDVLQMSVAKGGLSEFSDTDVELLNAELAAARSRRWRKAQLKAAVSDGRTIERLIGQGFKQLESAGGDLPGCLLVRIGELAAARAADALKHAPAPGGSYDLHCIRVRLKRLRYALELKQALADQMQEEPIRALKTAQDQLGDWNDQLQAVTFLSKLARKRRMLVERPEFAAHLLAHAARRLQRSRELADAFVEAWPGLVERLADEAGGIIHRSTI